MDYEDSKYQDNQSEALLEANNLVYKFDDPLSVSINKTGKRQYFATRTYTDKSGSCICDFNSGVDFVDGKNSYLKVEFTPTGGDATMLYSFGSGSICNIFQSCKILSSSGTEISRSENSNIFHKFRSIVAHSKLWYETVGSLMNAPADPSVDSHGPVEMKADGSETYVFLIPLSELDMFFKIYDNKLIPSVMSSGLRVELALEDYRQALYFKSGTGAAATGYKIVNIEFMTENSTYMDSAVAVLNSEASKDGLEIEYDRYFVAPNAVGTSLTANIEIRKAVALAKSSMTIALKTNEQNSLTNDGFKTPTYRYTTTDSRIGNLHFPFRPLETPEENYFQLLKNHGKIKHDHIETALTFNSYKNGNSILDYNYERDCSLNLSSIPVNQSRVAEVRFERVPVEDPVDNYKSYTFLIYTALARTSLQNCSVKI